MKKRANYLIGILLSAFFTTAVIAEEEKKAEKKWYDQVEFSGFVDVYYQYVANNKQGAQYDSSRAFATYNKQFGVNAVELALQKTADKASPWGFRINFMNGQNTTHQENNYGNANNTNNMNMLQEGFVSFYFPVMNGLTVDVGKMATHIGYELLETVDNPNYTIGYIFFNTIPFIHTGARAALSINDDWGFSFFLYNSVQGTGYNSANQQTGDHVYADGPNKAKAVGTQLSGQVVKQLKVVWNTIYGMDQAIARRTTMDEYIYQTYPSNTPGARPGSYTYDHWFVNEVILSITPTDKLTVDLDYTYGEKVGASAPNTNSGATVSGLLVNRDGRNVKRIYNTYGAWIKYAFTEKFLLALRYEYIDDSRYGGSMAVTRNDSYRYDLSYKSTSGYGDKKGTGAQVRTFTITPTYNWSENMIVKLDLRRDWGMGTPFVDESGRPASYQNGATLGIVAKF
ncbi:MAG: porin [Leptospiraceae bacterium]|nr:porin [Leptospiraceae bacterium]MCP5503414.1 porin [Leptospiraceae bacterium]